MNAPKKIICDLIIIMEVKRISSRQMIKDLNEVGYFDVKSPNYAHSDYDRRQVHTFGKKCVSTWST